jgi:tyrosyl-tRNA synthetase
MLAQENVERFHSRAAAEAALAGFEARFRHGALPEEMPEVVLRGAPMPIAQLLKQAQLAPSTTEANRNIDQGGVRVDGERIADKALKLPAGTYVVQVGKRRFARVRLEPAI